MRGRTANFGLAIPQLRVPDQITARAGRVAWRAGKLHRGSLQGLVDAPEANRLDPRSPATVVDISRVQTSDPSIALVMACTQAATELAWAHSVGQRWHVYDEFWRIATFGNSLRALTAAGGYRGRPAPRT
jgi:hypothetical protein